MEDNWPPRGRSLRSFNHRPQVMLVPPMGVVHIFFHISQVLIQFHVPDEDGGKRMLFAVLSERPSCCQPVPDQNIKGIIICFGSHRWPLFNRF